ncbi:hypothetical protein [Sinomonas sp. G460-2]|uniref:hypothetical protein n=1 Tax=Sinomonas sp. G460-2 TaxID=3393464 RepID=UPI0039F0C64C
MALRRRTFAIAATLGAALTTTACGGMFLGAPEAPPAGVEAILGHAVSDRTQAALETPTAAPTLSDDSTTDQFKANWARAVARIQASKKGFKGQGFTYIKADSEVAVKSWTTSGDTAQAHFTETTTLYLASAANGPSDVPTKYVAKETATFKRAGQGWVLDRVTSDEGQHGLSMTEVDIAP